MVCITACFDRICLTDPYLVNFIVATINPPLPVLPPIPSSKIHQRTQETSLDFF